MPYLQHLHANSSGSQNVNSLVTGSENNNVDHNSNPESRLIQNNPGVQIQDQEDTKDPLSAGIAVTPETSEVVNNLEHNSDPESRIIQNNLIPQETQNHQVNFFPERNY